MKLGPQEIFIGVLLFVNFCLIFVADIYWMVKGGSAATISDRMAMWSRRYPIVAGISCFVMGLLIGHLFWPNLGYCQ